MLPGTFCEDWGSEILQLHSSEVVCLSGADPDMKKMFLGTLSPLLVAWMQMWPRKGTAELWSRLGSSASMLGSNIHSVVGVET